MPSHRGGVVALHPDAGASQKGEVSAPAQVAVPSRGRYLNSGTGPSLHPVEIGHPDYIALVDPDTAFWTLVLKSKLAGLMADARFLAACRRKAR